MVLNYVEDGDLGRRCIGEGSGRPSDRRHRYDAVPYSLGQPEHGYGHFRRI